MTTMTVEEAKTPDGRRIYLYSFAGFEEPEDDEGQEVSSPGKEPKK